MFEERQIEILTKSIDHHGYHQQMDQAISELAELIIEISRHGTERFSMTKLIDEMADATLMIEKMKLLFDILDEDIKAVVDVKVERLAKEVR